MKSKKKISGRKNRKAGKISRVMKKEMMMRFNRIRLWPFNKKNSNNKKHPGHHNRNITIRSVKLVRI